jgi:hypothetical protein
MPKYRALSNIEHGEEGVDDQNQPTNVITSFPYGSIVEGLDKDTMKSLWDAGVLEEVGEEPVPTVTKTVTQTSSNDPSKSVSAPDSSGGAGTPPAAPANTDGSPKP